VRIIVASANLTEPGYRINQEVFTGLDSTPDAARVDAVTDACGFLRRLLAYVPGANVEAAEVRRSLTFLDQVEQRVSKWTPVKTAKGQRQHLAFTLPGRTDNPATGGPGFDASSSLNDAVRLSMNRGGAPDEVWIASPFFDIDDKKDAVTEALCKSMARGVTRRLSFCVPSIGEVNQDALRLAAPASLLRTAEQHSDVTNFELLPTHDADNNLRPWHAKMLGLLRSTGKGYTGLMIGSSNFTQAGMGIGTYRNAEANVLTIAEHLPRARDPRRLKEVWPDMERVEDPTTVEWQGSTAEMVEEQRASNIPVPAGFVSATYRAGDRRSVLLRLDPDHLPVDWSIHGTGRDGVTLLTSESWQQQGRREPMTLTWEPLLPPEKLLVRWTSGDGQRLEAFLPLNVEDAKQLPPPAELAEMSADDMLLILAASDPSAAFRVWARKRAKQDVFDENLDTALPPDLDPLRRYELKATFLRRVRSRARVLAQLRQNLQRPVWGVQALQWRLEGFIGIRPLAQRLLCEVLQSDGSVDEALLTLADLVILLREVEYEPVDGALPKRDFMKIYEPFLGRLVDELNGQVHSHRARVGRDLLSFWDRVVERCRN
jgi:hypothetical protein